MYRTQCVLVLLALYVGLVHCFSWDLVLGGKNGLNFYNKGTLTRSEAIPTADISSIKYDAVHNRLLFSDASNLAVITSFDLATKKVQNYMSCKSGGEYVIVLKFAYDPPTDTIFQVSTKTICSVSLKSKSNSAVDGNLLVQSDEYIMGIALDSCRGYIYWSTNKMIERARLDGSEREVVINSYVYWRPDLAIDQQTQKIYWMEKQYDVHTNNKTQLTIESADLNGSNRRTIYSALRSVLDGTLTLSKDFIYWRGMGYDANKFWQLPKNPPPYYSGDVGIKQFSITNIGNCSLCESLAANYKVEEEILINRNCERLTSLLSKEHINDATDLSPLCVHGTRVSGESRCKCTQGYTGERCNVSVCQNYCFHGECSASAEQPKCRCNAGYSGERCEVYGCQGYCLNNGVCSLNEKNESVCQCAEGYKGERCNVTVCQNHCFQGGCSVSADGQPKCRCYAGYSGERCEVNACHEYCLNNGACSLNGNGKPVCQCTGEFEGERCDVSVCQNYCIQGTCSVSAVGQPKCRCYAGYSGERCEVSACHGHCLNNGVCSLNNNSEPVCQCKGHYKGERCDVTVGQGNCTSSAGGEPKCRCDASNSSRTYEDKVCQGLCLNNGVCFINEEGNQACQCTVDYEGERCEIAVCKNYCFQGDCSVGADGLLKCRCNAGYTGERCEINACQGYCLNNGVCSLNVDGEPVCQCTEDYEGQRCDASVPVFLMKCFRMVSALSTSRDLLKTRLNICLVLSQLCGGRLPVSPDAAEYQYFTWSDCLSDLHNPVTGQHDTLGNTGCQTFGFLTTRNACQRSTNNNKECLRVTNGRPSTE